MYRTEDEDERGRSALGFTLGIGYWVLGMGSRMRRRCGGGGGESDGDGVGAGVGDTAGDEARAGAEDLPWIINVGTTLSFPTTQPRDHTITRPQKHTHTHANTNIINPNQLENGMREGVMTLLSFRRRIVYGMWFYGCGGFGVDVGVDVGVDGEVGGDVDAEGVDMERIGVSFDFDLLTYRWKRAPL